uniref:Uncharacterized protein n=1 Tax=mine drainage metagenome TaxID=410659 RepID=E6PKM5_9ZZZZ
MTGLLTEIVARGRRTWVVWLGVAKKAELFAGYKTREGALAAIAGMKQIQVRRKQAKVDARAASQADRQARQAALAEGARIYAANAALPSPLRVGDILVAELGPQRRDINGKPYSKRDLFPVWYFQVEAIGGNLGRETTMRRIADRREPLPDGSADVFSFHDDLPFPRVGVSWPVPGAFIQQAVVAQSDHAGHVSFCLGDAPPVRTAKPLPFIRIGPTRIDEGTPYCDGYPTRREMQHNPDWRKTGIVNQPPPLEPDPSIDPWGYLDAYGL